MHDHALRPKIEKDSKKLSRKNVLAKKTGLTLKDEAQEGSKKDLLISSKAKSKPGTQLNSGNSSTKNKIYSSQNSKETNAAGGKQKFKIIEKTDSHKSLENLLIESINEDTMEAKTKQDEDSFFENEFEIIPNVKKYQSDLVGFESKGKLIGEVSMIYPGCHN